MMNREWEIKFKPGQTAILDKSGTSCEVQIEGVSCHKAIGWQVIYDVREIESKVAYPASQKNLSGKPVKKLGQ
jgi:hypothetical protein